MIWRSMSLRDPKYSKICQSCKIHFSRKEMLSERMAAPCALLLSNINISGLLFNPLFPHHDSDKFFRLKNSCWTWRCSFPRTGKGHRNGGLDLRPGSSKSKWYRYVFLMCGTLSENMKARVHEFRCRSMVWSVRKYTRASPCRLVQEPYAERYYGYARWHLTFEEYKYLRLLLLSFF